MATLRMYGDTSGYTDLTVPDVGTNGAVSLPVSGDMITATSGTFTPSFINGSFTYAVQTGGYYKLGDLWFVSIRLQWSAKSGAGVCSIDGLPLTTKNVSENYSGLTITYQQGLDTGAANGNVFFVVNPNASLGTLYYGNDNAGPTAILVENCESTGQIILAGTLWGE